jgi:auxin responsive GH3 family protein
MLDRASQLRMSYTQMLLRGYHRRMEDPGAVLASFEALLADPRASQEQTLRSILQRHAKTEYGRSHGFDEISDHEGYRARVPVVTYDDVSPLVQRMMAGEPNVLVSGQASYFCTTSGSSAAPKFIPGTQQTILAGGEAIVVRNSYLQRDHPGAFAGRPLFIVGSMAEGRTEAGAAYGAMTGFGFHIGHAGFRGRPFPYEIFTIEDYAARYYCILRLALAEADLSMICVYNPSTLLLLLQTARREWDDLVNDIGTGRLRAGLDLPEAVRSVMEPFLVANPERARQLRRVRHDGPRSWWPRLAALMCWKGGSAGFYLQELRPWIGDLPVRDLGVVASEAMLTIAIDDVTAGGVLIPSTGFFEFVPAGGDEEGPSFGAWELDRGAEYRVLVTTHGGLYRYDLGDVVRVEGRHLEMPVLSFLHRAGRVHSFTGEKLTETQVTLAVRAAANTCGVALAGFTTIPTWDSPPYYQVCAEVAGKPTWLTCRKFAGHIETELQAANIEYASKRDSGRLNRIGLALVSPGTFEKIRRERGQDAQYKETHLAPIPPAVQPAMQVLARF